MNWDDVRVFLAVARSGQILGAAKRLELNHATVSRRIAALEEALRTKLFRRLTTGSELTPAGERFLDIAERMESDMIAARPTLAGEGDDVSGTVRGTVALASQAELRAAVENAKAAQPRWAATNPQRRVRVLMKFLELVGREYDELADILAREHG